ncbi:uncharacterized protein LOC117301682 [Asterias rubens]|uniref:uncharacterized protein LOC117301682 n=1 Tax=Asterias rubens TaxID=7604 RepID=UPI0014559CD1|nr:uncharacterized protein LOC117301682 [Asterias rubens]
MRRMRTKMRSTCRGFLLVVVFSLVTTYIILFHDDMVKTTKRETVFPTVRPTLRHEQPEHIKGSRSLLNTSNTTVQLHSKVTLEGPCYFHDKLHGDNLPDIHSVFSEPEIGQVVFVGLKFLKDPWSKTKFRCEFPDGQFSHTTQSLEDRRSFGHFPQYVVVLTCPLPDPYRLRISFTMNFTRLPGNQTYRDIKVCPSNSAPTEKYFLAMCTMVKNVDKFITNWLDFHKYFGVEHAYIYDNELKGKSTLQVALRKYIDDGFVTVIPWAHTVSRNKTYLEVQIAHENDCIWRHKHDVDWMMKIDVDEYVQPMDAKRPKITDYLKGSIYDNVASMRIQNWFFGHRKLISADDTTIFTRNRLRNRKPTLQNTGHDKNILRPINVHYFKIHSVKLGGDVISADPYTELRLVHYRADNPRTRHFKLPKLNVRDDSMVAMMQFVEKAKLGNDRQKTHQQKLIKPKKTVPEKGKEQQEQQKKQENGIKQQKKQQANGIEQQKKHQEKGIIQQKKQQEHGTEIQKKLQENGAEQQKKQENGTEQRKKQEKGTEQEKKQPDSKT